MKILDEKKKTKRRKKFVEVLRQTGSKKIAEQEIAQEFRVTAEAVRIDWRRRASWPKEIFEEINNPVFTFMYMLEIREALNQIEKIIRKTENSNCKLGAIRTKVDTLFKLVNLQRSVSLENILERMERIESTLKTLQEGNRSNSQEA
jgi:hypothetical protein